MNASSFGRLLRFLLSARAFVAALGLIAASAARAQSVVFPNFSSTTGLTINSATTGTTGVSSDGTVLHIANNSHNDRGSFFTTTTRNVASFSTAFAFRLSNRGGSSDGVHTGADGLVFVIQRAGNTSLGSNGEGMGYLGIGSSIGVEFDTFLNSTRSDPSSNHVGIDTLGSVTSLATANVTSSDFDDGTLWTAWVDYDGSTLEVRANNTGVRPSSPLLSYSLSLSTLNTTLGGTSAYVGFTAATGGAWADHDLVKWTFSESYLSGGVIAGSAIPEPSTWGALAGAGLLGFASLRRRFKRAP